jgi:hypothetical protein
MQGTVVQTHHNGGFGNNYISVFFLSVLGFELGVLCFLASSPSALFALFFINGLTFCPVLSAL